MKAESLLQSTCQIFENNKHINIGLYLGISIMALFAGTLLYRIFSGETYCSNTDLSLMAATFGNQ